MEDRRKLDAKNWEDFRKFMADSTAYRAKDEVVQKYQVENIESLKVAVNIQNGRVGKLEEWKLIIEQKIKQRKDNYATAQAVITVIATIVMAVAAWITIFNKK